MKKAIIGIDQSYTDTGIAIAAGGKILTAISLPLYWQANDTIKRNVLKDKLVDAINMCRDKKKDPIVYIEAVRINQGQTTFDYIKRAGAMESIIIDTCFYYNVDCRSVASNSWKAGILGSRKKVENEKGIAPEKYMAYKYTCRIGCDRYTLMECGDRTRKYVSLNSNGKKLKYNDNVGDACCISLYGCLPEEKQVYNVLVERSQ